jgi:hypothetical protein
MEGIVDLISHAGRSPSLESVVTVWPVWLAAPRNIDAIELIYDHRAHFIEISRFILL